MKRPVDSERCKSLFVITLGVAYSLIIIDLLGA
jgi:hypothetical protein